VAYADDAQGVFSMSQAAQGAALSRALFQGPRSAQQRRRRDTEQPEQPKPPVRPSTAQRLAELRALQGAQREGVRELRAPGLSTQQRAEIQAVLRDRGQEIARRNLALVREEDGIGQSLLAGRDDPVLNSPANIVAARAAGERDSAQRQRNAETDVQRRAQAALEFRAGLDRQRTQDRLRVGPNELAELERVREPAAQRRTEEAQDRERFAAERQRIRAGGDTEQSRPTEQSGPEAPQRSERDLRDIANRAAARRALQRDAQALDVDLGGEESSRVAAIRSITGQDVRDLDRQIEVAQRRAALAQLQGQGAATSQSDPIANAQAEVDRRTADTAVDASRITTAARLLGLTPDELGDQVDRTVKALTPPPSGLPGALDTLGDIVTFDFNLSGPRAAARFLTPLRGAAQRDPEAAAVVAQQILAGLRAAPRFDLIENSEAVRELFAIAGE